MTTQAAQIWDNEYAIDIIPELLDGLVITVEATLGGMAIALVLGLAVAVVRYLKIPVISPIFTFYVLFVRGTPLLVQAFFAFFVFSFSPLTTGILVLGINYSAYTAEVYRAGIEGLPKGQWEAATALSLPRARTWTKIVIPQSVKTIIPVLGNYWIQMFKDSAILQFISVLELLGKAQQISVSSGRALEPMTIAGAMYLIVSYTASLLVKRLERRHAPTQ